MSTLLDPAVSATVAATGLYLREGNPIEELSGHLGRDSCCNVRQRAVVLELFNMWSPFLGIEELIGAIAEGNGPVPKRLSSLKKVIISRMVLEAKSGITKKIYNEGWSGGISPKSLFCYMPPGPGVMALVATLFSDGRSTRMTMCG